MSPIETLAWKNVDVIGDVHGEIGALTSLLDRLGYDGNGDHPEDRKLVFVGDLVDRGPDSLAVFYLVKHFCDQGNAKCVLGNHELNLIVPDPSNRNPQKTTPKKKNGNHWFHGIPEAMIDDTNDIQFQRLASSQDRKTMQQFFYNLPIALESDSLRIVHACWDDHSIQLLRKEQGTVLEVYEKYSQLYRERSASFTNQTEAEFHKQNDNPIKVITSGLESYLSKNEKPYEAGKKTRFLKRAPWWKSYQQPQKVIFGHYWRRGPVDNTIATQLLNPKEKASIPVLFTESYSKWLGPKKNCMCVDYSVGRRFWERHLGIKEGQTGSFLAALRITEKDKFQSCTLIFDDGNEIVMPS